MHTVSSSASQQMVNLTKGQPMKQVNQRHTNYLCVCVLCFHLCVSLLKQVVNRLNFSHMEKTHLGSACEDGVVCLWSVESQRLLAKFAPSHAS